MLVVVIGLMYGLGTRSTATLRGLLAGKDGAAPMSEGEALAAYLDEGDDRGMLAGGRRPRSAILIIWLMVLKPGLWGRPVGRRSVFGRAQRSAERPPGP